LQQNEIRFESLAVKETREVLVFVRFKLVAAADSSKRIIVLKTQFESNFRQGSGTAEIALLVQQPFELVASVFNSNNLGTLLWTSRTSSTATQVTESPLILQNGESLDAALVLTSKAETNLRFSEIGLQMNMGADNLPNASVSSPPLPQDGLELEMSSSFTHWVRIKPLNAGLIHLGVFSLNWRRDSSKLSLLLSSSSSSLVIEYPVNSATLILPIVDAMQRDFSARFASAEVGNVGVPMSVSFLVNNRSAFASSFHIKVSDSPSFLLAGDKFATFSVGPQCECELSYTVVPLVTGRLPLPKFTLSTAGGGGFGLVQNWMTSPVHFIFVKPELNRTKLI
jgi:hypothetical protein